MRMAPEGAKPGPPSSEQMDVALTILHWTFSMEDSSEDYMLDHLLIGEMLRCSTESPALGEREPERSCPCRSAGKDGRSGTAS